MQLLPFSSSILDGEKGRLWLENKRGSERLSLTVDLRILTSGSNMGNTQNVFSLQPCLDETMMTSVATTQSDNIWKQWGMHEL